MEKMFKLLVLGLTIFFMSCQKEKEIPSNVNVLEKQKFYRNLGDNEIDSLLQKDYGIRINDTTIIVKTITKKNFTFSKITNRNCCGKFEYLILSRTPDNRIFKLEKISSRFSKNVIPLGERCSVHRIKIWEDCILDIIQLEEVVVTAESKPKQVTESELLDFVLVYGTKNMLDEFNYYSAIDWDFGETKGMPSPPTSVKPEKIRLELEKKYECQMSVINGVLKASSPLIDLINKVFDTDDKMNLRIVNNNLKDAVAAVSPAIKIEKDKADIKMLIDNNFLENTTNLGLATTFIHESVHAYMYHLFIKGKLVSTNSNYKKLQEMLISFYNQKEKREDANFRFQLEEEHHTVMKDFVDRIGNAVYQYAKSQKINVDEKYCNDLAWGSMRYTKIFEEIVPNKQERKRREKIFENEEKNKNKAKGSPCF